MAAPLSDRGSASAITVTASQHSLKSATNVSHYKSSLDASGLDPVKAVAAAVVVPNGTAATMVAEMAVEADTIAKRSTRASERSQLLSIGSTKSVAFPDSPVASPSKHYYINLPTASRDRPTAAEKPASPANVAKSRPKLIDALPSKDEAVKKAMVLDTHGYERVPPGIAGPQHHQDDLDHSYDEEVEIVQQCCRRRYNWDKAKRWCSRHCCTDTIHVVLVTALVLFILFLLGLIAGVSITHNIYDLMKVDRLNAKNKAHQHQQPRTYVG